MADEIKQGIPIENKEKVEENVQKEVPIPQNTSPANVGGASKTLGEGAKLLQDKSKAENPQEFEPVQDLDGLLTWGENEEEELEDEETEEDKRLYSSLRLDVERMKEFRCPTHRESFAHWRKDLQFLVKNVLIHPQEVDKVIYNLLKKGYFVIVTKKGTKKHNYIVELLFQLREPFQLMCVDLFYNNEIIYEFYECELASYALPFVLHRNYIYRDLYELEELLYRMHVRKPLSVSGAEMVEDEYDLIVIGNSVAGITTAVEAWKYIDRILLVCCLKDDHWMYGGKMKLFNVSSKTLETIRLGYKYGVCGTDMITLSWAEMMQNATNVTRQFSLQSEEKLEHVECVYTTAKFINEEELLLRPTDEGSDLRVVRSKCFVIATDTKSYIPNDVIGLKEHCITTEDFVSMHTPPGETLIIGDSSEGIECANIINASEFDVTILTGSGMQDCENYEQSFVRYLRQEMECRGVKFIDNCKILKVSIQENKKLVQGILNDNLLFEETFDTVVVALGKVPNSSFLGLSNTTIEISKSRHILADVYGQTTQGNVYALGPVVEGNPHSDAASEKAAKYLVERLYNYGSEKMEYGFIPKVVWGPLDYGCVGMTENLVRDLLQETSKIFKNISVYENNIKAMSTLCPWRILKIKMICAEDQNGKRIILGLHLIGHHIEEILTGFTAMVGPRGKPPERFDKILGFNESRNRLEHVKLNDINKVKEEPSIDMKRVNELIKIINTGKNGVEREEEPMEIKRVIAQVPPKKPTSICEDRIGTRKKVLKEKETKKDSVLKPHEVVNEISKPLNILTDVLELKEYSGFDMDASVRPTESAPSLESISIGEFILSKSSTEISVSEKSTSSEETAEEEESSMEEEESEEGSEDEEEGSNEESQETGDESPEGEGVTEETLIKSNNPEETVTSV